MLVCVFPELEATRRLEAEQGMQLKQFPVEHEVPVAVQTPDVIEINRLTWNQKLAALMGELCGLGSIGVAVAWMMEYRGSFGWSDSSNGDAIGNVGMWNSGYLCGIVGLFCLGQAILTYRILPLNTAAGLNRAMYVFWQLCSMVGLMMCLYVMVRTPPDSIFWGADSWCFVAALFVYATHWLYSMFQLTLARIRPTTYETWAETGNKLTLHESAEQRRDHSTFNQAGRTVYTPAPVYVPREAGHVPPASQNLGAEVPVAPTNAPRWAENPNTHSEDYFLLPRAKWAICGFVATGASLLMMLVGVQNNIASGRLQWAQGPLNPDDPMGERSSHSDIISALGVITFMSVLLIAYAAMPPRTTLVKNGILTGRRASISHNAETRIGNVV